MAREGFFHDLDAALVWHPSTETGVDHRSSLAMTNFRVSISGQAARANLDRVGTSDYPESFHRFAEAMQEGRGVEQEGLDPEVEPLEEEPGAGGEGSADVAGRAASPPEGPVPRELGPGRRAAARLGHQRLPRPRRNALAPGPRPR